MNKWIKLKNLFVCMEHINSMGVFLDSKPDDPDSNSLKFFCLHGEKYSFMDIKEDQGDRIMAKIAEFIKNDKDILNLERHWKNDEMA